MCMQTSDLTLVVPAYNEEASLQQFLPELLNFCAAHETQPAQIRKKDL